jgi:cytochrome-b5 reductase
VSESVIRKHALAPAVDSKVFVCGLPGVYDALCGPRGAPLRPGSALHSLGYTDGMVVKF